MRRYALVRNARSAEMVERYLPAGYAVLRSDAGPNGTPEVLIGGEDVAGWGLDSYIIPRLASGLIWAEEISALDSRLRGVTWV
jgi:hypothetical protein